jgi:hypothetical protein
MTFGIDSGPVGEAISNALQSFRPSLWDRLRGSDHLRGLALEHMAKAYVSAEKRTLEAAEQGAVVAQTLMLGGRYGTMQGVQDKTEATCSALRLYARQCEAVAAIRQCRVSQIAPFASRPEIDHGMPKGPGFRVRMTSRSHEATPEDRHNIERLEQMIEECGFVEPPEDERPITYQRGFEPFLRMVIDDRLTLGWFAVRMWSDKEDPHRFPVVSFQAWDAGRIQHARGWVDKVKRGVPVHTPPVDMREDPHGRVRYVEVGEGSSTGSVIAQYTDKQMAMWIGQPRTDTRLNGYGLGECELAMSSAASWVYARQYNSLRFRRDSLPRGFLTVFGNVDEHALQRIRLSFAQQGTGVDNSRSFPIVHGTPQTGSSIQWTPIDMSSRDMEYTQFFYTLGVIIHALFQIHPDETGFASASPFRAALSEPSPESQLKWSQDRGLNDLLRSVASFMNRQIVWRLYPDRRYSFEFVGLGDYDRMQRVEYYAQMLATGMITPRDVWAELDQPLPEGLEDHPAWDLPMPFAQGLQYVDSQRQQAIAEQQQQQQQAQGQEAHQASMDAHRMQMMAQSGQQQMEGGEEGDEENGQVDRSAGYSMQKALADIPIYLEPLLGRHA